MERACWNKFSIITLAAPNLFVMSGRIPGDIRKLAFVVSQGLAHTIRKESFFDDGPK